MEDYKKKYEEALENIKRIKAANKDNKELVDFIEYKYPELKESEDEKIRKEIVKYFKCYTGGDNVSAKFPKWIAYLEKKGEQKPIKYTLEQAAQIFLTALSETPYNNKPITDAQVITKELLKFLSDASSYNPNAINEQKHVDMKELTIQEKAKRYDEIIERANSLLSGNQLGNAWIYELLPELRKTTKVEPKFHEGDIIKPKDGRHKPWQIIQVDIFDKKYRFKDGYVIHFSQEDDYKLVEQKPTDIQSIEKRAHEVFPDDEDENTPLYRQAFIDGAVDYIDCGCKNPAWSEEDERMLTLCASSAKTRYTDGLLTDEEYKHASLWFKSLKERYTWKPSESDILLLERIANGKSNPQDFQASLGGLIGQLKKLKE